MCSICRQCLDAQDEVSVSEDGVRAAAAAMDVEAVLHACRAFKHPCKFDSLAHEISFMATMRMLEFGSGFDSLLANTDQKAAREVTQVRLATGAVTPATALRLGVRCSCACRGVPTQRLPLRFTRTLHFANVARFAEVEP